MKYGFVIPGGDVPEIVEVAVEIEKAGWDGVFVAETVYGTDAWVTLGAMAARTERVVLGTLLTPVSRRRPWKLASEAATLDKLSRGRAVISVGLGAIDTGFDEVGEETDRKARAELLDEGLEVMEQLWTGKAFRYEGKHYRVDWKNRWTYSPYERARVPVWSVALVGSRRTVDRALRWDGILPAKREADGSYVSLTPEDVAGVREYVKENRTQEGAFDIVIEGVTPLDKEGAREKVAPLAEAGATWWIESMWDTPGAKAVMDRIAAGPPRI